MSNFVDKNPSIQVRIDRGYHRLLQIKATREKTTIKTQIEASLAEFLGVDRRKK